MRVMVLGAGGMLGHDLLATAPFGIQLFPLSRAELDITDSRALAARVTELRPDVIINTAAYTAVDKAESEPDVAFRVNANAVWELGGAAANAGARVVHFSTDYVFDGTATEPYPEDAPPHPINVYGESKLAGERHLAASGAEWLIVRTQWLFGVHGRSFAKTMWERAVRRLPTRVVADQVGRPTSTIDLAKATWKLVDSGAAGIVHVANTEAATWHQMAERIFAAVGCPQLVSTCTTVEYPTAARRPAYSPLATERMEALLGSRLPRWQPAVDEFLRAVHAQQSEEPADEPR